jgi:hypothetical protein
MTDLRHGVSEATQEVLDMLESLGMVWENNHTLAAQLGEAREKAAAAHGAYITDGTLADVRAATVEAAARLLDALGEIDRCIAAGEA